MFRYVSLVCLIRYEALSWPYCNTIRLPGGSDLIGSTLYKGLGSICQFQVQSLDRAAGTRKGLYANKGKTYSSLILVIERWAWS